MIVLLPLSACLEMEQTVTIQANGSGSQKLRLGMSDAVLAEARRAAAVTAGADSGSPAQAYDRVAVEKELAALELQLKDHRTYERAGLRWVEAELAFADLPGLRRSPWSGSAPEWEFAQGPVPGTVQITLYPQGREAWGKARLQAEEWQTDPDPTVQGFFEKRRTQLAGLDVTLHFDLPGKVLRWTRNLEKTGDRRVTARVTAEQIKTPADLMRRLAPRFEVVIEDGAVAFPLDQR